MISRGLTFDDVLIVPQYSDLPSRESVDISTDIAGLLLDIPIVSSPMDTVTDWEMAIFMRENGGLGIIHRYQDIQDQVRSIRFARSKIDLVGASVSVNGDGFERTKMLIEEGANPIVFDLAHGHTLNALQRMDEVKRTYPEIVVISANLATVAAAKDAVSAGADALRVGIGAGSACTTRVVAGVGVPQLTAIMDITDVVNVPVIADGGIRTSGDMTKALGAGASAVMLGGLLARFPMSPQPGKFRGMASKGALNDFKGPLSPHIPEGETFETDIDYDYKETFDKWVGGIKLGLSYVGAATLHEFQSRCDFMEVTPHAAIEGTPHFGR